jgi:hypothetical protein
MPGIDERIFTKSRVEDLGTPLPDMRSGAVLAAGSYAGTRAPQQSRMCSDELLARVIARHPVPPRNAFV